MHNQLWLQLIILICIKYIGHLHVKFKKKKITQQETHFISSSWSVPKFRQSNFPKNVCMCILNFEFNGGILCTYSRWSQPNLVNQLCMEAASPGSKKLAFKRVSESWFIINRSHTCPFSFQFIFSLWKEEIERLLKKKMPLN